MIAVRRERGGDGDADDDNGDGDGERPDAAAARSCNTNMGVAAWALEAATVGGRAFRHFRIRQTGKNSSDHDHLMCTGIELYGRLIEE